MGAEQGAGARILMEEYDELTSWVRDYRRAFEEAEKLTSKGCNARVVPIHASAAGERVIVGFDVEVRV